MFGSPYPQSPPRPSSLGIYDCEQSIFLVISRVESKPNEPITTTATEVIEKHADDSDLEDLETTMAMLPEVKVPDLPLLLDGSSKNYPYDTTSSHLFKSVHPVAPK